jgi:hypothetical protein
MAYISYISRKPPINQSINLGSRLIGWNWMELNWIESRDDPITSWRPFIRLYEYISIIASVAVVVAVVSQLSL